MTRPEEWLTYEGAIKALSAPTITVYHGTTTPVEVIKEKGIQVYSLEAVRSFLDMRIRSLPMNVVRGKLLRRLPSLLEPPWEGFELGEVRVSPIYEVVLNYTVGPPEVITGWLWKVLPRALAIEAFMGLMEISGGMVYGKVVTLEVSTSWIPELVELGPKDYIDITGLIHASPESWNPKYVFEDVILDRSIPPSCIRKIEYTGPLTTERVLKDTLEWLED